MRARARIAVSLDCIEIERARAANDDLLVTTRAQRELTLFDRKRVHRSRPLRQQPPPPERHPERVAQYRNRLPAADPKAQAEPALSSNLS